MRDPGLAHLSGSTGLHIVDLMSSEETSLHFSQLNDIHTTFFGSYTNVFSEIEQFRLEVGKSSVTSHAWLVLDGERAVGEIIFHTSHRHKIGVMHFVALEEKVRQQLQLGWFNTLIEAVILSAQFNLQREGSALLGLIAEIPHEDLPRWERVGFQFLNIDYLEPAHGRSWKLYGEPAFFPLSAVVKCIPAPDKQPFSAIALSALSAFLIEHYELESDHPEVQRMLHAASQLED